MASEVNGAPVVWRVGPYGVLIDSKSTAVVFFQPETEGVSGLNWLGVLRRASAQTDAVVSASALASRGRFFQATVDAVLGAVAALSRRKDAAAQVNATASVAFVFLNQRYLANPVSSGQPRDAEGSVGVGPGRS